MLRSLNRSFAPSIRAFHYSRVGRQNENSKELTEIPNSLNISESRQEVANEKLSGAPRDLSSNRVVRIFQMAKPATQSGTFGTHVWRIDWDVVPRANKWENDMIGWASSGDYMQGTQMKFKTREDAIRFASNQGWDYYIQEPHKRDFGVKAYAENFVHSAGTLKHIRTK
jgi:NADH dehydrogenase (ubiquinone) Fe-S protein 4